MLRNKASTTHYLLVDNFTQLHHTTTLTTTDNYMRGTTAHLPKIQLKHHLSPPHTAGAQRASYNSQYKADDLPSVHHMIQRSIDMIARLILNYATVISKTFHAILNKLKRGC